MSQFEKLIGELATAATEQEVMTKALPAEDGKDDKKIQAAAEDGGLAVKKEGEGEDDGLAADGKPVMAKSFEITLENGDKIQAEDGTELIKSLTARIDANEAETAKVLGSAVALIQGQNTLIKSLQDQMLKLGSEGRGRKAVVSVVEKPAASELTKSQGEEGMSKEQFFAKALDAQKAGKISGLDVAMAEASVNRGENVPAHILQRVLG